LLTKPIQEEIYQNKRRNNRKPNNNSAVIKTTDYMPFEHQFKELHTSILYPEISHVRLPMPNPVPTAIAHLTTNTVLDNLPDDTKTLWLIIMPQAITLPYQPNVTFNPIYYQAGGDEIKNKVDLSLPVVKSLTREVGFPSMLFPSVVASRVISASVRITEISSSATRSGMGTLSRVFTFTDIDNILQLDSQTINNATYQSKANFSDDNASIRQIYSVLDSDGYNFRQNKISSTGPVAVGPPSTFYMPSLQAHFTGVNPKSEFNIEININFEYIPTASIRTMVDVEICKSDPIALSKAANALASATHSGVPEDFDLLRKHVNNKNNGKMKQTRELANIGRNAVQELKTFSRTGQDTPWWKSVLKSLTSFLGPLSGPADFVVDLVPND